jgi:hypothetical protein
MWSNHNNGHFGISKVIFGESGVYNAIIDLNGEYGITHGAMGIQINDLEEGEHILQALKSEKFNKIIKSMMFGNFRIDWNNFKTFKRDWWKEYVSIENCPVIYNRSNYGSDKKYVSKTESEEHKYPLVHATNKNGIRYMYSNCNDKGHFGVSKVIFGQTGINDVIIDLDGKYGMTEHAIAIEVTNLEEANNLKLALLSTKFKETLKSTMYSNFMIDWRIFTSFKRDWWKEYVDEETQPLTEVSNNEPNIEVNTLDEATLKKMTIPKLKTYIKEHKLKIKLSQKKGDLVKEILNYYK